MPLETPDFWYADNNRAPLLARAIAPLYEAGRRAHVALAARRLSKADAPVLCVGNATMGGAGKTPTTIALCKLLKESGLAQRPHILTRGYGRKSAAPLLLRDQQGYDYHDAGDEALLLARAAPVVVGSDRRKSAAIATENSSDLMLMDDGMQNYHLHHDITFMVINGAMGFGNGRLFPAGPLREPLDSAFAKTDAFVLIGTDERGISDILPADKPVFKANTRVPPGSIPPFDKPYLAFAGIGYPEKFFTTCKQAGLKLTGTQSFADHHPYSGADIAALYDMAERLDARLVTTEKDYVRLPLAWQDRVTVLPITLSFEEPQALTAFLKKHLKGEAS